MRLKRMSFEIHSCLRKIKRKWDIPPIHNIFLSSGLLEQSCALRPNTARYYYCEFCWPLTLYFSGSNHAKFMKRITFQLTQGLDLSPRNTCAIPIAVSGEGKMWFPGGFGWGRKHRLLGWSGELSLR